jgi:hypothetical protein
MPLMFHLCCIISVESQDARQTASENGCLNPQSIEAPFITSVGFPMPFLLTNLK